MLQDSICLSEPPDSPLNENELINEQSPIKSPQININISPVSPPTSPGDNSEDENHKMQEGGQDTNEVEHEKQNLLSSNNATVQNHPATINEEHEDESKNKSSLSLPHESSQIPTSPSSITSNNHTNINPINNHIPLSNSTSIPKPTLCERSQSDRRKLSVSNIISFGEQRRRSTSSIFSDMRKMSITNFDSLKSPGIGEIKSFIYYFYHLPRLFNSDV